MRLDSDRPERWHRQPEEGERLEPANSGVESRQRRRHSRSDRSVNPLHHLRRRRRHRRHSKRRYWENARTDNRNLLRSIYITIQATTVVIWMGRREGAGSLVVWFTEQLENGWRLHIPLSIGVHLWSTFWLEWIDGIFFKLSWSENMKSPFILTKSWIFKGSGDAWNRKYCKLLPASKILSEIVFLPHLPSETIRMRYLLNTAISWLTLSHTTCLK